MGRFEEAIVLYKKSLSLNGQFTDAYYRLGIAYDQAGDSQRAIYAYRKALWLDPSFASAYRSLARTYRRLGQNSLAAKYSALAR